MKYFIFLALIVLSISVFGKTDTIHIFHTDTLLIHTASNDTIYISDNENLVDIYKAMITDIENRYYIMFALILAIIGFGSWLNYSRIIKDSKKEVETGIGSAIAKIERLELEVEQKNYVSQGTLSRIMAIKSKGLAIKETDSKEQIMFVVHCVDGLLNAMWNYKRGNVPKDSKIVIESLSSVLNEIIDEKDSHVFLTQFGDSVGINKLVWGITEVPELLSEEGKVLHKLVVKILEQARSTKSIYELRKMSSVTAESIK